MLSAFQVVTVRVPASFNLATAVCSYGFFMLAPNRWLKVCQVLSVILAHMRLVNPAACHLF